MMKYKMGILAALLSLVVLRPHVAIAQDENKSKKNHAVREHEKLNDATTQVKLKISAEGKSSLPSASKIGWEGLDEGCRGANGQKTLESNGATSLILPVCRVQLMFFITDFDTKVLVLDMANKDGYGDPINITVPYVGDPKINWSAPATKDQSSSRTPRPSRVAFS